MFKHIFTKKMLICIFTGFSSGLPYYVLANLLPVWLRSEKVDLETIGFFSLVMLPFSWKFLWAPFLDYYVPKLGGKPILGRRRGWMLLTQIALLILLISLGIFSPNSEGKDIYGITAIAVVIAFLSASQDTVLDAFRREILSDQELGLGNSIHVNAYRISGLIPGSLSLYLTKYFTWHWVLVITGLFMLPALFLTLFLSTEPKVHALYKNHSLKESVVEPLREFWQRKGAYSALGVIGFLFLYKLGDSMASTLLSAFYLDLGFSKQDLAIIVKNSSLWPMVISSIVGGIIMLKIGINRSLWLFGLVQITTILGFVWLASLGHFNVIDTSAKLKLGLVVAGEYIGIGLGTSAFVAFMARETNPMYTATQLALFTSFASLPRSLISSFAGVFASEYGYYNFFWLCFFLAIPGMICLLWVAPWNSKNKVKPI